MSATRLSTFAVPDPHNLGLVIDSQSPVYRSFMVWARDPAGSHGLVGRINIANVVRGAFRSATVGYDAYDPYAGHGLFVEGLRLVIDIAFTDEPQGMGLHRLEANIQPANTRSAGLVRSLGLVHEGFSRGFLHLPGADGRRDWRDHDRYAILATDWPAAPYRHQPPRRLAAIVHGSPDPAGTELRRPPRRRPRAAPLHRVGRPWRPALRAAPRLHRRRRRRDRGRGAGAADGPGAGRARPQGRAGLRARPGTPPRRTSSAQRSRCERHTPEVSPARARGGRSGSTISGRMDGCTRRAGSPLA